MRNDSGSALCTFGEGTFLVVFRQGENYFVAYVEDADLVGGTLGLVAEGILTLESGDLTGPLEVVWPEPPDDTAPDLVMADLVLGPRVGTSKYFWNEPFGAFHARYTDYALTGTLTRPDDGVVGIDCQFQEATSWERYTVSAGQKPGGRPPVNELPGGAIELVPPTTLRTTTRGAAVPPEATCELVFETPEGPVGEVPLGRTVWYSLTHRYRR